jgi:hypothetical protein
MSFCSPPSSHAGGWEGLESGAIEQWSNERLFAAKEKVMTIKAEGISILSPDPDRTRFIQRGRNLQYLTIAWNSAEFVIALTAGFLAGSKRPGVRS